MPGRNQYVQYEAEEREEGELSQEDEHRRRVSKPYQSFDGEADVEEEYEGEEQEQEQVHEGEEEEEEEEEGEDGEYEGSFGYRGPPRFRSRSPRRSQYAASRSRSASPGAQPRHHFQPRHYQHHLHQQQYQHHQHQHRPSLPSQQSQYQSQSQSHSQRSRRAQRFHHSQPPSQHRNHSQPHQSHQPHQPPQPRDERLQRQIDQRLMEIQPRQELAIAASSDPAAQTQLTACWRWKQALPGCSDEVLSGLVYELYAHYFGDGTLDSEGAVRELVSRVFPMDLRTPHGEITRYQRYYEAFIFELWTACISRPSMDYDNNDELQRRLVVILERHKLITTIRQNMALLRETGDLSRPVTFTSLDTLQLVAEDATRLNPYQQSLLIVLNECHRNQYCRRGEHIYERVFYGNQFTYSYKQYMSVSEFVYHISGEDKTSLAWETMTTAHAIHKQVIEYVGNAINSYLPLYNADRHKFSFRNGMYSTLEDKFWRWNEIPTGSIACNFIDAEFDYFPDKTGLNQFFPSGIESDKDLEWWSEDPERDDW